MSNNRKIRIITGSLAIASGIALFAIRVWPEFAIQLWISAACLLLAGLLIMVCIHGLSRRATVWTLLLLLLPLFALLVSRYLF